MTFKALPWDLKLAQRAGNLERAVAHQHALFDQRLIDLLHEKRIAFALLGYEPLEWRDAFVSSQQGVQHLVRAIFAQRIDTQLW